MSYVDGFIIAGAEGPLDDYRRIATTASEVWREQAPSPMPNMSATTSLMAN